MISTELPPFKAAVASLNVTLTNFHTWKASVSPSCHSSADTWTFPVDGSWMWMVSFFSVGFPSQKNGIDHLPTVKQFFVRNPQTVFVYLLYIYMCVCIYKIISVHYVYISGWAFGCRRKFFSISLLMDGACLVEDKKRHKAATIATQRRKAKRATQNIWFLHGRRVPS